MMGILFREIVTTLERRPGYEYHRLAERGMACPSERDHADHRAGSNAHQDRGRRGKSEDSFPDHQ